MPPLPKPDRARRRRNTTAPMTVLPMAEALVTSGADGRKGGT